MITKTIPAYIGLLRTDGNEPSSESGYARVAMGNVAIPDIPGLLLRGQIVFNDVIAPGYGDIAAVALFQESENSPALWVWSLPSPVDVHEGVIPAIVNGQFIRGREVQAKVYLQSKDLCGTGRWEI